MGNLPELGLTARILNTVTNARKNISAHYDISNAMFMGERYSWLVVGCIWVTMCPRSVQNPPNTLRSGFLSKDMTYSCAIFPELDGDLRDPSPSSLESSPKEGRTPSPTGASTPATLAESEHSDVFKEFSLNVLGLFSHCDEAQHPHDPEVHDTLEEAQIRKLQHIVRKADIRPGHRVSDARTFTSGLSTDIMPVSA